MSRTPPPARVPTLTEVVETPLPPVPPAPEGRIEPRLGPATEYEIAEQIAGELQAHIERVLEARVRAALAPVLEQTVTSVVEKTRLELASTLRDGIARALGQRSPRHRNGGR